MDRGARRHLFPHGAGQQEEEEEEKEESHPRDDPRDVWMPLGGGLTAALMATVLVDEPGSFWMMEK